MAKLPALHFYVGDWRKSVDVQSLSYHEKGVFFEILCFLHESEDRGKLIVKGKALSDEAVFRLLGLDNQIGTTTLTSLLSAGVLDRDPETGALMSRRMVRDEKLRKVRTEVGKKGGNPALVNQKPTTIDNQIPEDEIENESTSELGRGSGGNPTLPEVHTYCSMGAGIPPEVGESFWNSMEGYGWLGKDSRPVKDWKALLRNYAKTWRANEQKAKTNGHARIEYPRDIEARKKALEEMMADLKNRFCHESPTGDEWADPEKRKAYLGMTTERKELIKKLAGQTT